MTRYLILEKIDMKYDLLNNKIQISINKEFAD